MFESGVGRITAWCRSQQIMSGCSVDGCACVLLMPSGIGTKLVETTIILLVFVWLQCKSVRLEQCCMQVLWEFAV